MNKEQIIDEAYENYCKRYWEFGYLQDKIFNGNSYYEHESEEYNFEEYSKEEFISKIKTDSEFSEKWGLKIEEREILKQIDQTNPTNAKILRNSRSCHHSKYA